MTKSEAEAEVKKINSKGPTWFCPECCEAVMGKKKLTAKEA